MPKQRPFAGLKLSESTSVPVDQRLFSTEPVQRPSGPVKNPLSQEVGKEGTREGGNEVGKQASQPASKPVGLAFDLAVKPYRKDSFLFTADEWEALEDLKLTLRRTYGLDATKNDLARCALHALIEDFKSKGEASMAVRRLRQKGGK